MLVGEQANRQKLAAEFCAGVHGVEALSNSDSHWYLYDLQ
jgi:hypothetical protein